MNALSSAKFLVYLLHFDQPVKRQRHYCGICQTERLHRRMQDHLSGNGAQLTRRCVEQGSGWQIVRLWPTDNRELERTIKAASHLNKHCAICQQGGYQLDLEGLDLHYAPATRSTTWQPAAWDNPLQLQREVVSRFVKNDKSA